MRILQIELIKLARMANYILLGLMLLFAGAFMVGVFYFIKEAKATTLNDVSISTMLIYVVKTINIFMSIFIIINVGKEFSDNTLRRSIIDGYTRDEFFAGKLALMLVTVVITYLLYQVLLLVGGAAIGNTAIVKDSYNIFFLMNPLIKLLAAGVVAVFLAFITRSVTIGLLLYFAWNVAEFMLEIFFSFLQTLKGGTIKYQNYLPLHSVDYIVATPEKVDTHLIFVSVGYLLLMLLVSYWLFEKRDIK